MSEEIKDFHPETPETVKYDPSKKYTWGGNDEFVLTGQEFGVVLNSLRSTLSTPEAQAFIKAAQASELVEGVLARAVEAGIAKEATETPKNSL